jgi:hypothetical protein
MTNREKIIVGIMLLTVGYGAIELLLPRTKAGSSAPPVQGAEGLNTFISKIAEAAKVATSETSALVIRKAEATWNQDPFMVIRKTAPLPAEKPASKEPLRPLPNMVYSGFVEIGAKRLAIINGMEYEAGDRVIPGDLSVKTILPNKVVMTSPQGEIVLPLQESE